MTQLIFTNYSSHNVQMRLIEDNSEGPGVTYWIPKDFTYTLPVHESSWFYQYYNADNGDNIDNGVFDGTGSTVVSIAFPDTGNPLFSALSGTPPATADAPTVDANILMELFIGGFGLVVVPLIIATIFRAVKTGINLGGTNQ